MGYSCQQIVSTFHIKKKKFPALHKAINDYKSEINVAGPLPLIQPDKEFLVDIFSNYYWDISFDKDTGDINSITFNSDRYRDCDGFMNTIGPYVDAGSYIEMQGEDGALRRWAFNGSECEGINGVRDFRKAGEILDSILQHPEILPMLIGIHSKLDEYISVMLLKVDNHKEKK